ncbi:hypothetical protein J7643_16410 [bacterium]|nr:hypothetical protein [bacterium]
MKPRPLILSALVATSGVIGCALVPPSVPQAPGIAVQIAPKLVGTVAFPEPREVAATTTEITQRATIALLDPANQTVAATVTDAAGAFTLDVSGAFTPTPGSYYTLEAVKTLKSATSAGTAVRMRTLLHWSGTAWNSCSGAVTLAISPATTAVALIRATQNSVTFAETMGVVTGSTITSANPTLSAHGANVRELVRDLLWRDLDPVARIALANGTYAPLPERTTVASANMGTGTFDGTVSLLDGSVQLKGSLPRPKAESEATASVSGLTTTAIVATDGTYLYSKPWDTDPTSPRTWTRIGTGYGGTTFGTNYFSYGPSMDVTNGGGVFGGLLYQIKSGNGNNGTLWRLNLSNGATDSVSIGAPMIDRSTGTTLDGDYLVSDGTYFYNGAFSINNGGYNGFVMRIYDAASRALLRQIYLDGANTPLANTSYYADSIFADGVYAYAMEYINPGAVGGARMRRYRLADGQLEAETTFPQDYPTDAPLSGTFDWVNNKFFFGVHNRPLLHRTAGRTFPASGTWISAPMDMGSNTPVFRRLNFNAVAVNGQTVRLQIRSAGSEVGLAGATWYGPTGTGDSYAVSASSLNPIHNGDRWVQIRATLAPAVQNATTGLGTTPRLYGVNLEAIR